MGGKVAKPARQADNAASGQGGDRAASVEGGAKKLEAGETSYHSKESRKDVSPGSAMKLLEAQESGWKDEDDKNGRTPISPFGKARHLEDSPLPTPGGKKATGKSPTVGRTGSRDSLRSHWSGLEESQDSPAVSTVAPLKKKDGPILTGETGRGDSLSRSESSGSVSDSGSGSDDELGNILKELDVVMAKKFGDKAANLTDLTAAVKEAFDEFDTDKIGFLNRKTFSSAMSILGLTLEAEQMGMLFHQFDTTGNGSVDVDEFLQMVKECVDDSQSYSSGSASEDSVWSDREWSSDSKALMKHPLILQVQAKEAKITGHAPVEGFYPYLILTYGNRQKSISSVKRQTANPSWNENFVFKVSDMTQDVELRCHHWDGKNDGPGRLLGIAYVNIANLLADFDGSESSSATGSHTESGSGATPLGSNPNRGRYLGQPGAPSPSLNSNPRNKKTPSPMAGGSPLQSSGLTTGGLPSAIQSTPGRGHAKRAAMKRKGRVHKHGCFKFQESQKFYSFTTEEGVRVGGGSGIRIRCRPWAPAGVHKQLKILRQQEMMAQQQQRGGIAALFSFGRQPTVKEDDEVSTSSGSSLSTLAESEDDDEYSSPDEVESEQPPNWSRKPAHIAHPQDMTNVYRNLFGDQTLEEQLKVLKRKQDLLISQDKHLEDENDGNSLSTDPVRIEQKIEVDMIIGVVQRRLRQSKRVDEMPTEAGWGWNPRSRRYTASGGICEGEFADGHGLDALGYEPQKEEGKEAEEGEEAPLRLESDFQEENDNDEGSSIEKPVAEHGDTSNLSSAPATPYRHAAALTPELFEIDEGAQSPIRAKTAGSDGGLRQRDTVEGRAWVEVGGEDIECTKAEFGRFRPVAGDLLRAEPAQANAVLTNAEAMKGCIAVVRRDPQNLKEHQGAHAEKVLKCVMAGAVGVIFVNSGRGYELMAPHDTSGVSKDWPDDWQVPIVCIRDTDAGFMKDGTSCTLQRRSNSPSISRPPEVEKSVKTSAEKSKESLKFGGVRFQQESQSSPPSPTARWESLEEDGGEGGKEKEVQSLSPLASALSRMGSRTKSMAVNNLNGMRRLSMNIKYKVLPMVGMGGAAVSKGIQDAVVLDEDTMISPLSRSNRQNPGVFKREPSSLAAEFMRASSFGRAPSLQRTGSSASASSRNLTNILTRSMSMRAVAGAVGLGALAKQSSQIIRVAEDIDLEETTHEERSRGSGSPITKSRSGSLSPAEHKSPWTGDKSQEPAVPLERFRRKKTGEADDIDPGECKVLRSLSAGEGDVAEDILHGASFRLKRSHSMDHVSDKSEKDRKALTRMRARKSVHLKMKQDAAGGAEEGAGESAANSLVKDDLKVPPPSLFKLASTSDSKVAVSGGSKLRSAVQREDEPEVVKEGKKGGEGEEAEMDPELQKKLKKITKHYRRTRSQDVVEAERKLQAGEELSTKEKLAVFMAEKKLKRAFSRATSAASVKANDDDNSFGRVMSSSFSRVMSGSSSTFSRVMSGSSQQFGAFQRSLSGTSETVFGRVPSSDSFQRPQAESFQRASDATSVKSRSRLQKKELALDEVLPLLSGAVKRPPTTVGCEHLPTPLASDVKSEGGESVQALCGGKASEGGEIAGRGEMKPKRPGSGRPTRVAAAPGPASRVKKES